MVSGITGGGDSSAVGMAVLEQQQQLAREGKTSRAANVELGLSAKEVASIFEGLVHAQRKFEETAGWVSAAMSVYSVGSSAVGVASTAVKWSKMTPAEQTAFVKKWEDDFAHPERQSTFSKVAQIGLGAVSATLSAARQRLKESDENNKKWADAFKVVAKGDLDVSDKFRKQVELETDVTRKLFQVGALIRAKSG